MAERDPIFEQIGLRIREVRIERNMSQADLAAKAHLALPHISDIERGKKQMHLATFIRITEALQVSADRLLRPDVPEVNAIYQAEFTDLLSDCSPNEIDSIIKIVEELKRSFHQKKTEYDN